MVIDTSHKGYKNVWNETHIHTNDTSKNRGNFNKMRGLYHCQYSIIIVKNGTIRGS